jgi:hypothetical protein
MSDPPSARRIKKWTSCKVNINGSQFHGTEYAICQDVKEVLDQQVIVVTCEKMKVLES